MNGASSAPPENPNGLRITMSNFALRVENLGKLYRIGGQQEKYQTLRDTISDAFIAPFRRARSLLHHQPYGAAGLEEEIWALKDVSFEVRHGETVGIIGRNGAGKSTLLKILSRITEPSTGYADIYGRVGALLEVGTGFHSELTGRENIYLNGAILGMSRQDINRKFDEIVDFAGVEKFIDTPVKHYSSGMGLRLGFAVAAHLEPDVLVVDEVLAVGDADFQRKCLGKMSDVASEGRTVLFVSHNMGAIASLTTRCIVFQDGMIVQNGDTKEGIEYYFNMNTAASLFEEASKKLPVGDESITLHACRINGRNEALFTSTDPIPIHFEYEVHRPVSGLRIGFDVLSSGGTTLFRAYHDDNLEQTAITLPGHYVSVCEIPDSLLNQGHYYIDVRVNIRAVKHIVILERFLSFRVENTLASNSAYGGARPGIVNPKLNWKTRIAAEVSEKQLD